MCPPGNVHSRFEQRRPGTSLHLPVRWFSHNFYSYYQHDRQDDDSARPGSVITGVAVPRPGIKRVANNQDPVRPDGGCENVIDQQPTVLRLSWHSLREAARRLTPVSGSHFASIDCCLIPFHCRLGFDHDLD